MDNFWTTYLKHVPSFTYEFSFTINKENFQSRILQFDEVFLKSGLRFEICVFDEMQSVVLIDKYLESRGRKFNKNSEENYSLQLYDLKQWEYYKGNGEWAILAPYILPNAQFVNKTFDYQGYIYTILSLENTDSLYKINLFEYDFEDSIIYVGINSSSNIWWEEIAVTILEGEAWKDRQVFNPPLNNRPWAYRITPRFNSFLRDLKGVINKLKGNVLLEEYNKKYVTEDGILLDGRIVYQEDIDEGRVKLPNLPHPA